MATKTANKILVIDDDSDILDFMIDLLQDEVSVSFASEGSKAIDLVKRHKPDLILLDVMMPDMDGFEVCKLLKADPETQHVPVVFLTSKKEEKDIVEGLGLGAVDYITKPFDPEIVSAKIQNILNQISATRASATPKQDARQTAGQSTDRRAEGEHRPDRTPKDANGPVMERRAMGESRANRFDKPAAPAKGMSLSRVLLIALVIVIAAGGGYAWYSNAGNKLMVADSTPSAEKPKTTEPAPLKDQATISETYNQQQEQSPSGGPSGIAGTSATTPSTESCEKVPAVPWWGNPTHSSIIAYVSNKNSGNWTAYIDKWQRQLTKLESVHAKGGTVIAPKLGTRLQGLVLAEYISQVEKRLTITKCLASKVAK